MTIYKIDKHTSYACSTGKEGDEMVSVFIDKAANEAGDTTYEVKEEEGGLTITTTKDMAHQIGVMFSSLSHTDEGDSALVKAMNQVISLVVGRDLAIKTNAFADNPADRVSELTTLAAQDLVKATQTGDIKTLKQAQRKLETLASLKIIAESLYEIS